MKPLFPYAFGYYVEIPDDFRGITKNTNVEGGEIIKGDGYLLYIKDTLSIEYKQKLIKEYAEYKKNKTLYED